MKQVNGPVSIKRDTVWPTLTFDSSWIVKKRDRYVSVSHRVSRFNASRRSFRSVTNINDWQIRSYNQLILWSFRSVNFASVFCFRWSMAVFEGYEEIRVRNQGWKTLQRGFTIHRISIGRGMIRSRLNSSRLHPVQPSNIDTTRNRAHFALKAWREFWKVPRVNTVSRRKFIR